MPLTVEQTLKKLHELADQKSASTFLFIDRAVTVATSALAFSITFRSSIIGTYPSHLWLLKTAWVAFGITSVFGVFLQLSTASAVNSVIRAMQAGDVIGSSSGSAHPVYTLLFRSLAVAFPVGISALMAFGVINAH